MSRRRCAEPGDDGGVYVVKLSSDRTDITNYTAARKHPVTCAVGGINEHRHSATKLGGGHPFPAGHYGAINGSPDVRGQGSSSPRVAQRYRERRQSSSASPGCRSLVCDAPNAQSTEVPPAAKESGTGPDVPIRGVRPSSKAVAGCRCSFRSATTSTRSGATDPPRFNQGTTHGEARPQTTGFDTLTLSQLDDPLAAYRWIKTPADAVRALDAIKSENVEEAHVAADRVLLALFDAHAADVSAAWRRVQERCDGFGFAEARR